MRAHYKLAFAHPIKLIALLVLSCGGGPALALPSGSQVAQGNASFQQNGSTLTINNSAGTVINWQGFSIGQGETVRFVQPSAASSVLNRVLGGNPSNLLGMLQSNGHVWLINPAGILVGPNARIDVAGLVAATLNVQDGNFLAGRLRFDPTPGAGAISNQGLISTPRGGHIYLAGSSVDNSGILQAPGGAVGLAAGSAIRIGDSALPGITVSLGGGSATNSGQILAEAGNIGLVGALVKNSGLIDASSVSQQGGRVFLLGNKVAVLDGASVHANGAGGGTILLGGDLHGANPEVPDASFAYFGHGASLSADAVGQGNGGKVVVWANDTTHAYGNISARGGAQGGNGGMVEVSGKQTLDFHAAVDTQAPAGTTGTLLLDPSDVTIATVPGVTSTGTCSVATTQSCTPPATLTSGITQSNPDSSDALFSQGTGTSTVDWFDINTQLNKNNVFITTDGSGALNGGRLTVSTGSSFNTSHSLNLFANGDIVATGVNVINSGSGDINLTAGWSGQWQGAAAASLPQNTVSNGSGSIKLQGSQFITNGNMNWNAGQQISVLGGQGGKLSAIVQANGTQILNAPTIAIQGGDGGNGSFASVQAGGNQTVNATQLTVLGGGSSGAFSNDSATLTVTGNASAQSINIAPGGSIAITAGSGSGLTQFLDLNGNVACSNCISMNQANLTSRGSQTVNFAGGATPTLVLTGGLGGVGNQAQLWAQGSQTLTGAPAITLNGGTGGSSAIINDSTGNPVMLANQAQIASASTATRQTISAASITLQGQGDANTTGGVQIYAPLQTINVSGNVQLTGGASNASSAGGTLAQINGNDLKLTAGGNLALTGGSGSNAQAYLGTQVAGGTLLANVGGSMQLSDGSGSPFGFTAGNASLFVGGSFTATGRLPHTLVTPQPGSPASNPAAGSMSLFAAGDITLNGMQLNDTGSGAYNLMAGWNGQTAASGAAAVAGSGSIVLQNSNLVSGGSFNLVAGKQVEVLGGSGNGVSSNLQLGGTLNVTAPSLIIRAGSGGNGNSATVSSSGNQTLNVGSLLVQGGGDGGAWYENRASLRVDGSGASQTINIGAGGSLAIQSGSGTGLTDATDSGTGQLLCHACSSHNSADVRSAGTQTVNFAAGSASPSALAAASLAGTSGVSSSSGTAATLTLTAGSAGTGNSVQLRGMAGQTITGQANIVLQGGTGGSSVGGSAIRNLELSGSPDNLGKLLNGAIIESDSSSATQTLSAASIRLNAGGDSNTAGGVAIYAPLQSITVSGDVSVTGGLSNEAVQGTPAALFGNNLTMKIGGNLALNGGAGSNSPAVLGNPVNGVVSLALAGSLTRSGNVQTAPSVTVNGKSLAELTAPPTTPAAPPVSTPTATVASELTADTIARAAAAPAVALAATTAAFSQPSSDLSISAASESKAAPVASPSAAAVEDSKPASHGKPDMAALAAMLTQHHDARAALYKGALEQLQQNPAAADAKDCRAGAPQGAGDVCIRTDTLGKLQINARSEVTTIRKHIALLFGNDAYRDPAIPKLRTPEADVQAVAEQLHRKFGFETRIVTNATKADIYREMNKLAGEVGPADSVLIMYAGHGYLMDQINMGFWIPVDAQTSSPANWVSNRDISRFLRAIPSRQILLVSDSCFSGSLTDEHKIKAMKKLKRLQILRQRSVTALSSGGDEPVADGGPEARHSVFAGQLLNTLSGLNANVTGFELYNGLYKAVTEAFPQSPQYGAVLSAGYSGEGDYLIDPKQAK